MSEETEWLSIGLALVFAGLLGCTGPSSAELQAPACESRAQLPSGLTSISWCGKGEPLYVCCGPGEAGCVGLENAGACPEGWPLYQCTQGEQGQDENGVPWVECHD